MAAEAHEFLPVKQFLERHRGLISESTLRRYIENGDIEVAQPGGPKSKIYIRSDALFRRNAKLRPKPGSQADDANSASPQPKTTTPRWKRGH